MNASNVLRRLVLVTPKVVSSDGQGRVNYEIVTRLARGGRRITILAMQVAPELHALAGVRVVLIPLGSIRIQLIRSTLFSLVASVWLARYRTLDDVVQIDGGTTIARSDVNAAHFVHAAWGRSAFHVSKIDRGFRGWYHRALNALHRFEELRAYRLARRIVAVSTLVKRELCAIGIDESKIDVVSLGVDSAMFRPGPSDRARFGLPEDTFVAAFAGDMTTPRKNVDTILRALRAAPNVHLVVIGSLEKNPYPALAREYGIEDRVSFLGFRRDVADVLRACDAFVFPSRYEPFGLVVLEAMACGLPVLTAESTGASDVVDASCGFVFADADDWSGMAGALVRLGEDRELLRTMGVAARARAELRNWDSVAAQFSRTYDDVVREPETQR